MKISHPSEFGKTVYLPIHKVRYGPEKTVLNHLKRWPLNRGSTVELKYQLLRIDRLHPSLEILIYVGNFLNTKRVPRGARISEFATCMCFPPSLDLYCG